MQFSVLSSSVFRACRTLAQPSNKSCEHPLDVHDLLVQAAYLLAVQKRQVRTDKSKSYSSSPAEPMATCRYRANSRVPPRQAPSAIFEGIGQRPVSFGLSDRTFPIVEMWLSLRTREGSVSATFCHTLRFLKSCMAPLLHVICRCEVPRSLELQRQRPTQLWKKSRRELRTEN